MNITDNHKIRTNQLTSRRKKVTMTPCAVLEVRLGRFFCVRFAAGLREIDFFLVDCTADFLEEEVRYLLSATNGGFLRPESLMCSPARQNYF